MFLFVANDHVPLFAAVAISSCVGCFSTLFWQEIKKPTSKKHNKILVADFMMIIFLGERSNSFLLPIHKGSADF